MIAPLPPDRLTWFRKARFGLFIHWGLYSVHGRGEWAMSREAWPADDYALLADAFTADAFDPRQWARDAREAGMRYAVLTTKHHDGFCLWDSTLCPFNAKRSVAGRDLVAEFVEAFRSEGLKVGLYYSLGDWRHPGWRDGRHDPADREGFVAYTHGLVEELLTGYGRIDVLWYDLPQTYTPADWRMVDLNGRVRSLQPDILINNRGMTAEDFSTPEQHVAAAPPGRMWESCMTLNQHWGYCPGDHDWKDARAVALTLARVAAGGGNLLLNVGPDASGRWPDAAHRVLRDVGRWLGMHGQAVYDTHRHALPWLGVGPQTLSADGRTLYVFLERYYGDTLHVGGLVPHVTSARLLEPDVALTAERVDEAHPIAGSRTTIAGLPATPPPGVALPVVALEFDASAESTLSTLLAAADVFPVLPD